MTPEHKALVARLRQYGGRQFETTACYNGLRDEAAAAIESLSAQGEAEAVGVKPLEWVTAPAPVPDAVEAGARLIAKWLGYAWDGLHDGSIVAKGFPVFTRGQFCGFQGYKDDLRNLARDIQSALASNKPVENGYVPAAQECATEGCDNPAMVHFIRGGIGSYYCHDCYMRVQALAASGKLNR